MPEVKSRSSPKGKKLRKLRKYLFHYILLAAFCLAIVFVMCYTVFFKLDKIQVTGCSVYSEQQIIDEIGAEEGESLFRINILERGKNAARQIAVHPFGQDIPAVSNNPEGGD